jgi:hypothetical protein
VSKESQKKTEKKAEKTEQEKAKTVGLSEQELDKVSGGSSNLNLSKSNVN